MFSTKYQKLQTNINSLRDNREIFALRWGMCGREGRGGGIRTGQQCKKK
jgi:hypothetical protein